jgi:beta-N-acetylhexosaminidase
MWKTLFFFCLAAVSLYPSLKEMSLEEKVGQLLIAHFPGKEVNEEARILVQEIGVGGIIYYEWANGLDAPQQVQNLSNGLQTLAEIPLFISADQEGGRVARLKAGFTVFPGNGALGRIDDPGLTELCAYAMGKEMRAVGINLNFAPVVDVNCNEKNPVIGNRSFGNSPIHVTEHGKSALKGYKRARVLTTLKHFPGHGDVTSDSHESLPVVHKSLDALRKMELYPFEQLAPFADMIMTAHILVPTLDANNCATLSVPILKDLLRSELGFQGVIISDSLIMEGVLSQCQNLEEAALRAFNAGCDMLILGGRQLLGQRKHYELTVQDMKRIHRFFVEAVKNKRISEADLDTSVQRILHLKKKLDLSPITPSDIAGSVRTKEHLDLVDQLINSPADK